MPHGVGRRLYAVGAAGFGETLLLDHRVMGFDDVG